MSVTVPFFGDQLIVNSDPLYHPYIGTGGLFYSANLSIPALVQLFGGEDHLAPAVEYPEIVICFYSNREWCEQFVPAIGIGCKGRRHIDGRTFLDLYFHIPLPFAAIACSPPIPGRSFHRRWYC